MIKLIIIILVPVFVLQWRLFIPQTWYEQRIGNINEFVQSHGYPIENHEVQTEDGYILTVHRIPSGKGQILSDGSKNKPPVFLMHGLLLSSMDWVVLGPEKSIGLMLADAGYDVWLGNNRGNTYSRNHVSLDPDKDKAQFFNYSYHEIGIYDLPAMIDYVLDKTGHQKITYIGYSEGVSSFLVMGALRPEYNENILLINAYAPVTNLYNITSVIFNFLALSPKILGFLFFFSYHEISIYDLPAMIDYVLDKTGHQKINYIGYSEGVTSFLVMGALRPEYNEKILLMNAYAPVTNMYNITSVIYNFLALSPKILGAADLIGWYEMFDHTTDSVFRLICQIKPICSVFFRSIGMSQEQQPDKESLLTLLSNFPAGASLKQIVHYVQGTRTGIFGPHNPELTNAWDTKEVSYDLTKVTAPIILYYGEGDNVVNTENLVNSIAKELPNVVKIYRIPYPNFNHVDYIWGKDIRLLTEETLKNINMYNNKTEI